MGIAYLLWNRSSWIADKILAPFGLDELWDEEEQIIDRAPLLEENIPLQETLSEESSIKRLSRTEIESLCFTVIAVWVLSSSIPEFFESIFSFFSNPNFGESGRYDVIRLISPFLKTIVAAALLFKSNNLVSWLNSWREHRMQD